MRFLNLGALLLILFVPPLLILFSRFKNRGYLRFSSIKYIKQIKVKKPVLNTRALLLLRGLAIVFAIIALARPQSFIEHTKVYSEGIDIMLAVDTSTSMLAEDFTFGGKRQNRLYVVKQTVEDFINARQNDRIGIIAFAGRPYTACPLTLDYSWLSKNMERIKIGMLEDGTAIGSAIATSLNRLKGSSAKSKILILLTDGRNNAGNISPQTAAQAAKALGIKIYTIGAGTKGLAPYPTQDFFGNKVYQPIRIDIDDEGLKEVADITGGEYFRATDTKTLQEIYAKIDKMEKVKIEETGYTEYKELFGRFLLLGFLFLAIEMILANTLLRSIP